ncbi:MAG: hypothetical protein L6V35_09440 [Alistipes putredinis]|nr:MAG: hypothetical protein L6V35_09440 [Alistipes putredinis]
MKRIGIKTILLAAGLILCAAMNISGREYSVRQVPNVQPARCGEIRQQPRRHSFRRSRRDHRFDAFGP